MTDRNIDLFAARLGDAQLGNLPCFHAQQDCMRRLTWIDVKQKLSVATDLRDNIDLLCNGPSYTPFLKKLVPVFTKLLEGQPVFTSTSWEQVC